MLIGKSSASNLLTKCVLLASLLSGLESAQAQHPGHGGPQFGVSAATAGIIAETIPVNDSVLGMAPARVQLNFDHPVELVKLVVYSNQRDWVDIGFRYAPGAESEFSWPVPGLQDAPYYSVNWAILDERDRLVKGSFSFSFGPGAESPSAIMAREMLHMNPQAMPGMDELQQSEPAEIRFSDRPGPTFEPPFAPVLGQPN